MKLLLTIENGTLAGRIYELTTGFLTVGRGETCAVRFDPLHERVASKQHAYLEKKADGFYLIDNQSTNGTLLNGQKIQTSKLNSGDRIQFGRNGVEALINLVSDAQAGQPTIQQAGINTPANVQAVRTEQFQTPAVFGNSFVGLSVDHLQKPTNRTSSSKTIFAAAAVFVVLFLAFIVSLLIFASVGIVAAVEASVVAFVPAAFYILPLIWLDRYDPEPPWLLALAFAWGALVAVIASFIINTVLGAILGEVFSMVISAPVFEEGSKGLGVVILLVFFRRYFDDILDGIIFAGVIALGFATVENILYYGREIAAGSDGHFQAIFIARGIFSPFAHVTFTAMTGIGCGISRESHKAFVKFLMPFVGYGAAVFLHAFWNGTLTFAGRGAIIAYIVLEVPFFLIFVGFAFYTMHRQNKILKDMLAIDVIRGLIQPEKLKIATSAFNSSLWIVEGLFSGKFKARSNYIRAIGKLGLSYWHIQRATAAHGHTGSFQQNPILRDEVLKWRDKV
ncbi:MAG: PrsW family glutamic-type intramembrane protease [Acidobacteriota bacterium]|nr:PrsW family glutamic-type intramembrane protease [Acidobacteriota bacterium]